MRFLVNLSIGATAAALHAGCAAPPDVGATSKPPDVAVTTSKLTSGTLYVGPGFDGAFQALAQWGGITPFAPAIESSTVAESCLHAGTAGVCSAGYEYLTGRVGTPVQTGVSTQVMGHFRTIALTASGSALAPTLNDLKAAAFSPTCSGTIGGVAANLWREPDTAPATESFVRSAGLTQWCSTVTTVWRDGTGLHAMRGTQSVDITACNQAGTAEACIGVKVAGDVHAIGFTSRLAIGSGLRAAPIDGHAWSDSSYPLVQPMDVETLTTHGSDPTLDDIASALADPDGRAAFVGALQSEGADIE